jgi:hypothetical protein
MKGASRKAAKPLKTAKSLFKAFLGGLAALREECL